MTPDPLGGESESGWTASALAVLAAALVLAVVADALGVPYVRAGIGVAVLSVAGGLAIAAATGVDIDRAEAVVYTVATSIITLMLLGVALNILFGDSLGSALGVTPFTSATLLVAVVALLGAVAAMLWWRGGRVPRPSFPYRDLLSPVPLFLLHLPAIAICGALIDRWFAVPTLRLASIALVAVVPLGLLAVRAKERYGPLAVYCGSLALFYQTTLSTEYFSGGDGTMEFYFANRVLTEGVWSPAFTGTKTSLLSLVVVHPIYTLVSGLDLLTTMRVVYPLLFAFTPVAVYLVHRRLFGHRTALLSAFLITFMHPYFRLLSQNSRSGLALLFVSCFALVVVDRVRGPAFAAYSTLFLFGVVVSHYGVIAMFVGLVGLAYLGGLLDEYIPWSDFPGERLRYPTVLFVGVLFLAWYIYTASTVNFYRLVNVTVNSVVFGFDDMFGSQSNATQAVRMGFESLTYRLIRIEYVLVTLLSGIGFLHVSLSSRLFDRFDRNPTIARLRDIDVPIHPSFHMFAVGANLLLLISFAPIGIIGVARVYSLAAIFIVPFGVFELRWLLGRFDAALPSPRRVPTASIVAVFIALLLVVNSGFLSATVTHGRSPQPDLERERIEATGTDRERYHLYRHYTSPSDVAATEWLFTRGPDVDRMDRSMYVTARHGGFNQRFFTAADWAYHADPHPFTTEGFARADDAFFIRSAYMDISGQAILTPPADGSFPFVELTPLSTLGLDDEHRVYDNGRSSLYWSGNGTDDTDA